MSIVHGCHAFWCQALGKQGNRPESSIRQHPFYTPLSSVENRMLVSVKGCRISGPKAIAIMPSKNLFVPSVRGWAGHAIENGHDYTPGGQPGRHQGCGIPSTDVTSGQWARASKEQGLSVKATRSSVLKHI